MDALSESRNSVEICDRVGFIQNANRSSALGSIVQPAAARTYCIYCIMLRHGFIKDLKERVENLYIKTTLPLPVRPYITVLLMGCFGVLNAISSSSDSQLHSNRTNVNQSW